jgi:hypothetical protein
LQLQLQFKVFRFRPKKETNKKGTYNKRNRPQTKQTKKEKDNNEPHQKDKKIDRENDLHTY